MAPLPVNAGAAAHGRPLLAPPAPPEFRRRPLPCPCGAVSATPTPCSATAPTPRTSRRRRSSTPCARSSGASGREAGELADHDRAQHRAAALAQQQARPAEVELDHDVASRSRRTKDPRWTTSCGRCSGSRPRSAKRSSCASSKAARTRRSRRSSGSPPVRSRRCSSGPAARSRRSSRTSSPATALSSPCQAARRPPVAEGAAASRRAPARVPLLCAPGAAVQHRRAFGALALLPLPFSLTLFREAPARRRREGCRRSVPEA